MEFIEFQWGYQIRCRINSLRYMASSWRKTIFFFRKKKTNPEISSLNLKNEPWSRWTFLLHFIMCNNLPGFVYIITSHYIYIRNNYFKSYYPGRSVDSEESKINNDENTSWSGGEGPNWLKYRKTISCIPYPSPFENV